MLHAAIKLDCFGEIQEFSKKYLQSYEGEDIYAIKPIVLPSELFTKLNLELTSCELPVIGSSIAFKRRNCFLDIETGLPKYIHVDSTPSQEVTCTSLIIPVEGCEDTYMYYFEGNYVKEFKFVVGGTVSTMKLRWDTGPKVMDRICVDVHPTIAKVDIPHDAVSRNDGSYRSVITFRFFGNPSFEEVYTKLEKYDRIIK